MTIIGLALLVALCIPIVGLLVDSPIGRGIGERLSGSRGDRSPPPADDELARRIELLEGDVEILQHNIQELKDESEFLQKLLQDERPHRTLPPDGA